MTDLFKTAVKKAKAGEHQEAQALLLQIVQKNPQHELAWLWLSQLVKEPEDKIIALENALTINPQRSQTLERLRKLRQKHPEIKAAKDDSFSGSDSPLIPTTEQSRFEQISQLFAIENIAEGRRQLATFLHRYSQNVAAWWLMAQHADSQLNQLKALHHLLRLNSHHPEALTLLDNIKPTPEEYYLVGRLYEQLEQWETAVKYYKFALKSPINADRLLAQKRLPYAENQLRLANIKVTSSTATVLRLALGPVILYGMLAIVQAGINPLQLSPVLCLGNAVLAVGLLLTGMLRYEPDHPWLQQLRETAVFQNQAILRLIGLACIVIPFLFLLVLAVSRLLAFELDVNNP